MSQPCFANKTSADWLNQHQSKPVMVDENASIDQIINALLIEDRRDAYVVNADNKVIGHIGFANVATHLLSEHRVTHTHRQLFARVIEPTAKELMDPHFTSAYEDELLCDVIHRQLDHGLDDLIVLSRDTHVPLGAIQLKDVLAESLCLE
ncbi:MAG: CBS domain-containing protein [Gammaproteobacteria bacterium]|nr:CBS domain-containing protein [Gammaproteobacteria bacterium]